MKDFVARHPLMAGNSLAMILYILTLVLVDLYSRSYFLILIPMLVILIGTFVFATNWLWVCTKCGQEAHSTRNKYCRHCGGVMRLKKKAKMFCPNDHLVDMWGRFCPKCGTSLEEKD